MRAEAASALHRIIYGLGHHIDQDSDFKLTAVSGSPSILPDHIGTTIPM